MITVENPNEAALKKIVVDRNDMKPFNVSLFFKIKNELQQLNFKIVCKIDNLMLKINREF